MSAADQAIRPTAPPQRHLFVKLLLGAFAGALAYLLILPLHTPWEELLAAVLIGGLPAAADRSWRRAVVGAAACAVGWLLASMAFGVWIELGAGAWLGAGAFLGCAAGIARGFSWRAPAGFLLGFLAGALAEAARFLPVGLAVLRMWDPQLLLLLAAGALLNLVAAGITPVGRHLHA